MKSSSKDSVPMLNVFAAIYVIIIGVLALIR